MKKLKINFWAVILIVVLSQVIGMTWYGIFAETWMTMNELSMEFIMENESSSPYIMAIISSFAFAMVLAWLFKRMNVQSAKDGFITAIIMGIPFSLFNLMTVYMFSYEPYGLAWIDGGENLVVWGMAGIVLGGWRKYEDA
jgi:hypothetical protein